MREAVWAAHPEGDLPTAVALASKLETTLAGWFGDDAATVTVMTARAWLTLCRRTDRYGTTELLIATALRCQAGPVPPQGRHDPYGPLLRKESPERAADLTGRLVDMLAILGKDDRRRDCLIGV